MKKIYKSLFAVILLSCMNTAQLSAQLSGLYTINSGSPASASNFQSFTALAAALTTSGVAGPVTVNVASNSGPYTEQPTFGQIAGVSATNTITINGNGNLLTFNSTSSGAPHTLLLNGSDFMNINNLNVQGQGATYAMVCVLTGGANNNVFSACTFSAPANGTSSYQVPFALSGLATSPSSGSNSGNNNIVTGCQMFSGYYGMYLSGLASGASANQTGNQVIGCTIQDFYYYGVYAYFQWFSNIKNNTIERPTRTTLNYFYGLMLYYTQGAVVDGNILQKPFETNPTQTSYYAYCMYIYGYYNVTSFGVQKNEIKNNIVRNIRSGYYVYGMLLGYPDAKIYHNTISLDDATSTSSGTTYGIYGYSAVSYESEIKNNIISITRGGSGTKYGIYQYTAANLWSVDGNDIYVNSAGGGNNHGYWVTVNAPNFSTWQAQGVDQAGANINPQFVNNNTDNHPTNITLNNLGLPLGVAYDQQNAIRNVNTPDMGALEFLTPTCTNTPANSVSGPNYSLCSGETANFGIGALSSDLGYTYQWQTSPTSSVGPFTPVSGANGITYTQPNVTSTMWVSVIITCTSPGGGSVTAVRQVNIAGPTSSVVPYFESFEGIGLNDRLPNCSWSSNSLGNNARTYTAAGSNNRLPLTGNSFAAFSNASPGTSYYYTNGIYLNQGVTYSASVWFQTDLTGATNWSNFALMYGTTQSTTGLTQIATTNGAAVSPVYKSLSNTFQVPTSAMYYIAVKATGASGGAPYLSWDDLRIIIPCSPTLNTPTISLTANNNTVCSGQLLTITANGANSYSWTGGSTGPVLTDYPVTNTSYMVTGMSTLTGCSANVSMNITVNQSPVISVFAYPPVICSGKSAMLVASGAALYSWSQGGTSSNVNVSPTSNTTYTVDGTAANTCVTRAVITISVNNTPSITAGASSNSICAGDPVTLNGTGGVSYQWISASPASVLQGNNIMAYPSSNVQYTVTGTDLNGCEGVAYVSVTVNSCVGLTSYAMTPGLTVYPNPNAGEFTIDINNGKQNSVFVTDVTGRVLMSNKAVGSSMQADIRSYAAGIYYVKVVTEGQTSVIKIVKE